MKKRLVPEKRPEILFLVIGQPPYTDHNKKRDYPKDYMCDQFIAS